MTPARLLAALGLAVVGVVTAVATVALHTRWWGLPLAAAGLAAALRAVRRGWLTRLPLGVGFALAVGAALVTPAEGGFLVATGATGWALVLLTLVVLVATVVTLPVPRRGAKSAGEGART